MKTTCLVALALLATVPALGGQQPSGSEELKSLHGTQITMTSDSEGMSSQIWAKGNNLRLEMTVGNQKAISIQLGDTLYTYVEGSKAGTKQPLGRGLGSMGLIRQIEEIKARGKKEGSQELEGVRYVEYKYDVNFPAEAADAWLSATTSLPRIWFSVVRTADSTASGLRMVFRDMVANPDIPDDMFKLPPGVTFSESP